MYVLVVEGEQLPMEMLKVSGGREAIKLYQLSSCKSQELQLVLEHMSETEELTEAKEHSRMRVQTFGNFEVFVDGRPVGFKREKAKELFVYLVDRHGASVTTRQIAATLWEDADYDTSLKNKVTRTVSSLKSTMKSIGYEDIIIKSWNHLAVDIAKFSCDSYEYEHMDELAVNSFRGEYMANYSWAEYTTGKYVQMQQSWNKVK